MASINGDTKNVQLEDVRFGPSWTEHCIHVAAKGKGKGKGKKESTGSVPPPPSSKAAKKGRRDSKTEKKTSVAEVEETSIAKPSEEGSEKGSEINAADYIPVKKDVVIGKYSIDWATLTFDVLNHFQEYEYLFVFFCHVSVLKCC